MNSNEDRNNKILILILSVGLIALIAYKVFFEKKDEERTIIDTETIELVTNPNDFYTVSSCVSKYLNYLTIHDSEKILLLLSEEYKNNNSITGSNLNNYISYFNDRHTFDPREMYVQRLDESIYKFYVYGLIGVDSMLSDTTLTDYYIIVILDRSNLTFSIEPYDGEMFK